jgi:hypothetical protein
MSDRASVLKMPDPVSVLNMPNRVSILKRRDRISVLKLPDRVSVLKGSHLTGREKIKIHTTEPQTQRRPGSPHSKKRAPPATPSSIRFGSRFIRKYFLLSHFGHGRTVCGKTQQP